MDHKAGNKSRKLVIKVDLLDKNDNSIMDNVFFNAIIIEESLPECFTEHTVPLFMVETAGATQRFLRALAEYHSAQQTQDKVSDERHNNTDDVFRQIPFVYYQAHL